MDDTVKRTDLMHGLREVFRSAERLISNPDLGIG
jgi:phosphatidate phosphatase APP1